MSSDCPQRLDGVLGVDDLHSPSAAFKTVIVFNGIPLGARFVAASFCRTRLAMEGEAGEGSGKFREQGRNAGKGDEKTQQLNNKVCPVICRCVPTVLI